MRDEIRRRNDDEGKFSPTVIKHRHNPQNSTNQQAKHALHRTYLAAPLFTALTGSLFTSFLVLLVREMRGWLLSTAVVLEVVDSAGSVVGCWCK